MISIIVAVGKNREIGSKNGLLWKIPGELKRFRQITEGHPIIMGRKTYESIGRPLPKRTNIVITRNENFKPDGVVIVKSLEEAIAKAKEIDSSEIFIIGGGQIYNQALPLAEKLYLTVVDADFPQADTYFPDYSDFDKVLFQEKHREEKYAYQFIVLSRDNGRGE